MARYRTSCLVSVASKSTSRPAVRKLFRWKTAPAACMARAAGETSQPPSAVGAKIVAELAKATAAGRLEHSLG